MSVPRLRHFFRHDDPKRSARDKNPHTLPVSLWGYLSSLGKVSLKNERPESNNHHFFAQSKYPLLQGSRL
jgi:hypothetical protein